MPRTPLALLPLALLATAPLGAQNAPTLPGEPASVGKDDVKKAGPTTVTLPDLTELTQAKDGRTLRRLVEMARIRIGEIKDAEERALTQGTIDAIESDPSLAQKILAAHTIRLAEVRDKAPDIIFLRGLKDCKTDAEVVRFSRELYAQVDKVGDPVLKLRVKLSLAKLEDKPAEKEKIYGEHMKVVATRFYDAARVSFAANNAPAAFSSIQIAVRCDPSNIKARFLFAHLLQSSLGETEKAIRTLAIGLDFISPGDSATTEYLDRYFQLLESRESDSEVISAAATLLAKPGFDARGRDMLAMHLATCLYYVGRYEESLRLIGEEHLDKRSQGVLLKARALFEARRTEIATKLLEDSVSNFQGVERDAILYQLQRFWSDLGKNEMALSVADQRVREFPDRSGARVHRLWLLNRMGDGRRFEAEVKELFSRFGDNQSAMLGVANFAAERALPDLATDCFRRATTLNFNRPLFALLVLEARIHAKQYREALVDHASFLSLDKSMFKADEASVHALLAAAKVGLGDKLSRNEAERHLKSFLEAPKLQPVSYLSTARLFATVGDKALARKVLEVGRAVHPWNNAIRAEFTLERILAGLTDDANGTRPPVADEIVEIAKGRRVTPRFWEVTGFWLRTESTLTGEKRAQLEKIVALNARPDLVREDADN